ncbi:hypothetical protein K7432_008204 [Basidiobolus ranarum]|uniref:Arrestin C-terminal-like domain-containing protein n=1 Tax=Basidiobolus ranarum TaxID=34480 RepID=A0ABR2WS84_9FUNG
MSPKLEIQVEQDRFYKSVFDDANSFFILRGKVVLTPSSTMKAQHIYLRFLGESVLNRAIQASRSALFEHKWDFSQGTGTQVFQPRPYSFTFELALPVDLPESAEADYAKIQYGLKVTVETPIFSPNITASRSIYIHRTIDSLTSVPYNTHLEDTWRNMVDYEIVIPSPEYMPGDTIPITFKHHALNSRCKVINIWAGLSEKTLYNKSGGDARANGDIVKKRLQVRGAAITNSLESSLSLNISKCCKEVHFDCCTPYIEVTHMLNTRIAVELDGVVKCISAVLPIRIVRDTGNNFISQEANGVEQLPNYFTVKFDCPPDYFHHVANLTEMES